MARPKKPLPTPQPATRDLLRTPRDLQPGSLAYRAVRSWSRRLSAAAGWPLARIWGPRFAQAFGVLMYHRVTELTTGTPEPTYNVPPVQFRAQLAGLLKAGYQAWPLKKVIEHHEEQRPIPRKTFVVTFDDGYASVHRYALPILRELQVPATIFLATAYLDSPRPFPSDDWSVTGTEVVPPVAWRPLTTDQCRELAACDLIELAAHTHTHQDFRSRPAELYLDMLQCQDVLRDRFGISEPTFAFPYGTRTLGFCADDMTAAVQASGARCALSTEDGLIFPAADRFHWGRLEVDSYDTSRSLESRLSGWSAIFQQFSTALGRVFRRTPASGR